MKLFDLKNPSLVLLICIYALLVPLLHFVFSNHDMERFAQLAERAVRTEGYITGKMCDDHGYYLYKFRVNEQGYQGDLKPHGHNCEDLNIGDVIQVWYLPDNPSINTDSDPFIHLESRITSDWIGAFWLSLVVFGLHPKLRRNSWLPKVGVR